jgi:hypothetical protein
MEEFLGQVLFLLAGVGLLACSAVVATMLAKWLLG